MRIFTPRAYRKNQKIQYKINREQYRDIKAGKRQARHEQVNEQLFGDPQGPWWREPTLGGMISRMRH